MLVLVGFVFVALVDMVMGTVLARMRMLVPGVAALVVVGVLMVVAVFMGVGVRMLVAVLAHAGMLVFVFVLVGMLMRVQVMVFVVAFHGSLLCAWPMY